MQTVFLDLQLCVGIAATVALSVAFAALQNACRTRKRKQFAKCTRKHITEFKEEQAICPLCGTCSENNDMFEISRLSQQYTVRRLTETNVDDVFRLCIGNPTYYLHCPPPITPQSICDDMRALPPNKTFADKFYVGFFDGDKLVAVCDLILRYPNDKTAFIGFFMTEKSVQNHGIGSRIIAEICSALKNNGFDCVRLGWVSGNTQAEKFWRKNGFEPTGVISEQALYNVVVAQKTLSKRN